MRGFVASLGEDVPLESVMGLCIGEQTAREARKQGIRTRTAKQATIDALVALAAEIQEEQR